MSKKVRVSDESLNVYGFWVKTSGIDTSDFVKNPICLWNHNQSWRGLEDEVLPIGIWKDLSVNGAEMTAVPELDTEDSFAKRISDKFEKGHLRAASIGIQILEWSEDPALLKSGQTRPTVTRCKLREISLVDIPANKNAVVLYDQDGSVLNLSDAGALPALPTITSQSVQTNMEEVKTLAAQLGLPNTATLADVLAGINDLKKLKADNDTLRAQLKDWQDKQAEARKTEVKALLDAALSDRRISAAARPVYEKLFEADFDSAKVALESLPKPVGLASFTADGDKNDAGKLTHNGKTFSQLSKDDSAALTALKSTDFAKFNALFKSEYGKDFVK